MDGSHQVARASPQGPPRVELHTPGAEPRIGLVLSGGGLRGAGHIGVLQQLMAQDIPIDVIVGSSAGAIVAAYYAAVGLSLDELEADARVFRGRHLLAHSLNVRLDWRFDRILRAYSGVIPHRLEQLDAASFERLHHGIHALGIVCHDVVARRPCYFSSSDHRGVRLGDVVRATASIPGLFPPMVVASGGETLQLTDGGVSDCLPIAFAQRPPLSATHLIVSDCRWFAPGRVENTANVVFIRPPLVTTGSLWAPSSTLLEAVRQGAAAVTTQIVGRINDWRSGRDSVRPESFQGSH